MVVVATIAQRRAVRARWGPASLYDTYFHCDREAPVWQPCRFLHFKPYMKTARSTYFGSMHGSDHRTEKGGQSELGRSVTML